MPAADRRRLLALCEPVELVLAQVLCERGDKTLHAVFPTQGFLSLVTQLDAHPGVEVGMVGAEGMLGSHLALDMDVAPLKALVQGAGHALRIDAQAFRAELARSAALQRVMHHYISVRVAQLVSATACMRFHLIAPRLARWLLMSQDRMQADTFHITQEFLAYMLGVRRVGVTEAASVLQNRQLIEYRRGALTVRNRAGLEAAACSCYAADRKAYADLMPAPNHAAH